MARKPSGSTGPFVARSNGDGTVSGQHIQVSWPENQKAIERKILDLFIIEFEKNGAKFLKIQDGGDKELDFLITTPGGNAYLELMEAVIPDPLGSVPFQPGNRRFNPVDYADAIYKNIQKKVDKYGLVHEVPIDLLIYVTHQQYNPNEAALNVLRRYLLDRANSFHYVFFLVPSFENTATLNVIFNRDHPQSPPPIEESKDREWINIVSSGFQVATN